MLREAEWCRNRVVPKIEEYVENGYISIALGPIILPALYFVGPKLSEEIVKSPEIQNLFKLTSTCARLLNDIQTFKVYSFKNDTPILFFMHSDHKCTSNYMCPYILQRESEAGKLNAVTLNLAHNGRFNTEEDVVKELKGTICLARKELLRLVLTEKGSIVPRECKELFWKVSKMAHLFYMEDDGFTSLELTDAVNAVVYKPVDLAASQASS